MDNATLITIVSIAIGVIGLFFGIYKHFSTRKIAKLTYTISQISDFGVPASFLQDMNQAPVAITVTSRGNKCTENVIGQVRMSHQIDEFEFDPQSTAISVDGNEIHFQVERLNPSQQIHLWLRCQGNPVKNQIEDFTLSHSEGQGMPESQQRSIAFNFIGLKLEYDMKESTLRFRGIDF